MTDLLSLPAPTQDASPPEVPRWKRLAPWIAGCGAMAGALVLALSWRAPAPTLALGPAPGPTTTAVDLTGIEQQLQRLEARLARLEQRPQPAVPDLAPLTARIDMLERRPGGDPALTAQFHALAGRIEGLTGRTQSAETEIVRRIEADDARLSGVERLARQSAVQAEKAEKAARIQAAWSALNAGRPIGALANAPLALSRFANVAPPTDSTLRQAWAGAERSALAASRPDSSGRPFLERGWARLTELVTIRQGDRVLVGDPAAGVMARARSALDGGDLAGAVAAVGSLSGLAADAMAVWLADAKALLAARAALVDLAERG